MPAQNKNPDIVPDDMETTNEAPVQSQKQDSNRRRLADSINSKGRKLKLDRRVDHNDRRLDTASKYKGPTRRKTIDQRESTKDRRNED